MFVHKQTHAHAQRLSFDLSILEKYPTTICNKSTRVDCPLTFKDLVLDNAASKLIKPSFIQISLKVSAHHQFQSTYVFAKAVREFGQFHGKVAV